MRYFTLTLLLALFLIFTCNIGCSGSSSGSGGGNNITGGGGTSPAPPSGGQAYGLTIAASHPRLWWNAARISQAKTWLASNPFTPDSTDYFNQAWMHVVSGSDCSAAVTWAASTLQIPSGEASPSGNGSDVARDNGEIAFVVFDWCYDQWSTTQKSAFISNWNTWLAGIDQQTHGGPASFQNNYNWGNLRNDIEYGVGTYGGDNGGTAGTPADNLLKDGIVTRYTNNFVPASTTSGAGGVPQEGTEYGAALAAYPMIPFQSSQLLGVDAYNQTPYFKAMAYWIIYGTLPAPTYNVGTATSVWELNPFGDDEIFPEGGVLAKRNYYEDFMNFASNYWSGINVGKYARQWVNTTGAANTTDPFVLAQDTASPSSAISYSALPLDLYASGVGYLYSRKAWDTSSTVLFLQMGTTTGADHFHSDSGNWQIWRGGRWLSRETTAYTDDFPGYTGTATGWPIQSISISGTTVTVATSTATSLAVGRPFSITGATTAYNGAYQVATVNPTGTQFTFTCSGTACSGTNVGVGGTVVPIIGDYYSFAHNMLGINGNAPANNSTFDIGRIGTWLGPPSINRLESQTGYAYADVDLSNVYQFNSNYTSFNFGAGHVEREFVFVRGLETLVILDRLTSVANGSQLANNATKTFLAHFEVAPTLEDTNHVTETNGTQVLRLTTLLPATPAGQRVVNEASCSGCSANGQYRLEVDDTGCAQSYFLTVLQARDTSTANLTASVVDSQPGCGSAGNGTFTVTLQPSAGAATTIVFNKGTSSSGGSITLPSAGTTSFRTSVQPVTYTDNGPVWGN